MLTPFAGSRDLYLLVAGIVLGVLLGPAVLGRLAPSTYQSMFSVPQLTQTLDQFDEQTQDKILAMKGVTRTAIEEYTQQRAGQRAVIAQAAQGRRDLRAMGLATAIALALLATMVIEAAIAPTLNTAPAHRRATVPRLLPRLVTVRYALAAGWLAIVLARPGLLGNMPLVFAGILVVLALGLGLVPLGPGRRTTSED